MNWHSNIAVVLAAVALTTDASARSDSGLAGNVQELFGSDIATVHGNGRTLTIDIQCAGGESGESYCILASMTAYRTVMQGIVDHKIDVTGHELKFATLMQRPTRNGPDEEVVILAAFWDGTALMQADWSKLSLYEAIDRVDNVQADRSWQTDWGLSDACTRMYGCPPRFCAKARESARR